MSEQSAEPKSTKPRVARTVAMTLFLVLPVAALGIVIYLYNYGPGLIPGLLGIKAPEIGVPMQCPAEMVSNDAGLCFDKCPNGYEWDKAAFCYQRCPSDWPGSSTLTHCQKDRKHSGAHSVLEIGSCPQGTEQKVDLCYEICPPDWDRKGTLDCYQNCPSGFRDDRLYCAKPGPQTRRSYCWGVHDHAHWDDPERSCREENPQGCEKSAPTCWVPNCPANFHGAGAALCSPDCPPGWGDIGVSCKKPSRMTSGQPKTKQCPPNQEELSPSLCYEHCPERYKRDGGDMEFCTSVCPPGSVDIGMGGCQRDKKSVGSHPLTDVGGCFDSTHPHKKGLLCYTKA